MQALTDHTIAVLNNMIEVQNDRLEGYEKALGMVEEHDDIKAMLSDGRSVSYYCREELRNAIVELGGNPVEGRTLPPGSYHSWAIIPSTASGHYRKSIFNVFEVGEHATQKAYEHAIKNNLLPDDIRKMLAKQKQRLQKQRRQVNQLHKTELKKEKAMTLSARENFLK